MNDISLKVGFIGLGLMGHGIASNVQQHGYSIAVFEHSGNQPTDDLIEKGAQSYRDLQALAADSDIVIICVTGSAQVEQIVLSEQGILHALKPGALVIDCSTSMPSSTLKIHRHLLDAEIGFMDVPMTRTPKEAAAGRLNLIVGSDADLFQEQLPLLQCFAENVTYAGKVGSGHTMKLIHNFVSLGYSAILTEAAACASAQGVDDSVLIEVLAKGGGAGAILDRISPYIEQGDDSSFRFSLANAAKDMDYYVTMAEQSAADASSAQVIKDLYSDALEFSEEGSSVPHLLDYLMRRRKEA